ncbi:hypothetical protein SmJEL517_g02104 [Synchytrium microbalum]|uniref:Uncharacterized protein n=1 Tax=Synchytrium microbalum TaxID=1806994 RepID=A0A507C7V9_9FUNG|nr:uncharacterized protein SmJEL517_g02104 [Synchytrium microbalum]TPX35591.1 hypothetical protein SmJEL517_g02104 [Synchytrium microbalum]
MPISSTRAGNPLLVPHEVGKTKRSVYNLPNSDFTYGKTYERDPNDTAACSLQWHGKAVKHRNALDAPLDYVVMNRNAARKGLLTPGQVKAYRAENPVRVKLTEPQDAAALRHPKLPSDKNPSHTYGQLVRPSTPVARLMTDKYQREWIATMKAKEEEEMRVEKEKLRKKNSHSIIPKKTPQKPQQKVAKLGILPNDHPMTLYKMPRFRDVPAKIVSHRDETVAPAAEV